MSHVTALARWNADKREFAFDDGCALAWQVRSMKPEAGERFAIRIEREQDAKKHHQLKWYYGYVIKQCVERTGYTVPELDAMFRALFMPGDVETLSLMSYEQMRDFNLQSEQYAAEVIGVVIVGPRERFAA